MFLSGWCGSFPVPPDCWLASCCLGLGPVAPCFDLLGLACPELLGLATSCFAATFGATVIATDSQTTFAAVVVVD